MFFQVTKLDRDPASGTALQEISFWLNLERALLRIQDIRESPDIALTLEILKHGKRFHATVSFDTDTGNFILLLKKLSGIFIMTKLYKSFSTIKVSSHGLLNLGLKQALATVNDYNPLMKDFPLDDLLAATELDKIRAALSATFTHLKKIRSTKYPIQRALRLVEAISRDLSSQLLKVCHQSDSLNLSLKDIYSAQI